MKDVKLIEIDYYWVKFWDSDLFRLDFVLFSLFFGVKELYDMDEVY